MPKPDPRDIRRLPALEGRTVPAREAPGLAAVERQQLLDRLKAAEEENKRLARATKDAEKELEKAAKEKEAIQRAADEKLKQAETKAAQTLDQVEPLLEENRRLAAGLDELTDEVKQVRELAAGLKRDFDKVAADLKTASAARKELAENMKAVEKERTVLQSRIDLAEQQLTAQGKVTVLPPAEVARLTHDLVGQLQGGLGMLKIRQGELRLKVAFAGAGKITGMVVPTADSDPKLKDSLQEITFQFDSTDDAQAK